MKGRPLTHSDIMPSLTMSLQANKPADDLVRILEFLVAAEAKLPRGHVVSLGCDLKDREFVQGRTFGPHDMESGRRVSVDEIVGVVQDAHYNDLTSAPPNMIYLPAAEADDFLNGLEIQTAGRPDTLVETIRTALREAEPRLPLTFINTLDEQVRRTISPERLLTSLTMAFSGAALFLACLGLYGTMSYAVTRRTAELGLRMALGASRGSVQWLVMREALSLHPMAALQCSRRPALGGCARSGL
jgi:hypothetical protein